MSPVLFLQPGLETNLSMGSLFLLLPPFIFILFLGCLRRLLALFFFLEYHRPFVLRFGKKKSLIFYLLSGFFLLYHHSGFLLGVDFDRPSFRLGVTSIGLRYPCHFFDLDSFVFGRYW
ncbi:hypothetical protein MCOR25_010967 [Pyricularia grisea]|nr:hypothetical protein MCOR25_010967 [Pyricularia grisea]